MSAVPAARYLADFGVDGDGRALQADGGSIGKGDGGTSAKLDEAFARGVENGRAAADAECQVKLDALQREFAVRLAAEREQWAAGVGEELASRLVTAVAEFEKRVADTTARILKPFLAAELHRQAIAELHTAVEALLATDSGVSLGISGPADVLEALRKHLGDKAKTVVYTPSDCCDVRVVAGQAVLETRLGSWMAKLEEATR